MGQGLSGSVASVKSGYKFTGWYTGQNKTGLLTTDVHYKPSVDTAVHNKTYYAIFEALPNVTITYKVKTNGTDSNVGGTVNGKTTDTETVSPIPTSSINGANASAKTGFTFKNWTDQNGKEVGTNALYKPTPGSSGVFEEATYYANFEEAPDVVYNYVALEGGTVNPTYESVAPYTGTAHGSTASANTGYVFDYWTDASGNRLSSPAKLEHVKSGSA